MREKRDGCAMKMVSAIFLFWLQNLFVLLVLLVMPKDNRYDKDGKPLANKFVINLAKQTRDNIDAYLLDLYFPDLLI